MIFRPLLLAMTIAIVIPLFSYGKAEYFTRRYAVEFRERVKQLESWGDLRLLKVLHYSNDSVKTIAIVCEKPRKDRAQCSGYFYSFERIGHAWFNGSDSDILWGGNTSEKLTWPIY
jgi:hypothetical protein